MFFHNSHTAYLEPVPSLSFLAHAASQLQDFLPFLRTPGSSSDFCLGGRTILAFHSIRNNISLCAAHLHTVKRSGSSKNGTSDELSQIYFRSAHKPFRKPCDPFWMQRYYTIGNKTFALRKK